MFVVLLVLSAEDHPGPGGFPGGSVVKNPPASAGGMRDSGSIPGSGRSLEEGIATHSSLLAWRITWTEEPGGIQSIGLQRVRHDSAHKAHIHISRS